MSSLQSPEGTNGVAQEENAPTPAGCYSEDYFSSGSDDDANQVGGVASKSQMRRKITSDEDMFYDPNMDAEDESWVEEQRFSHRKGKLEASELTGLSVEAGSRRISAGCDAESSRLFCPESLLKVL